MPITPSIFQNCVQAWRTRLLSAGTLELRGWKFGVVAAIAVVMVTSIPQLNIMIRRGGDWQGSYALIDYDELAYSSYVNSLIAGQPRRNDPYARDLDRSGRSAENLFSIQFLPAYAVALASRLLGLSASSAFIVLMPLMAFASSLTVFWLLKKLTADPKTAAVGVLLVLLCGRLISENPFVSLQYYGSFAFLRRYIPAIPFPLFFVFCAFIWQAFTTRSPRGWASALSAGVIFGVLVFSYFYLWTAAAAWLFCFTLLWIVARPAERFHATVCVLLTTLISLLALIPYSHLLSLRATTMDTSQVLVFSRAPDFLRICEIAGLLILLAIAWSARRGKTNWRSPEVIFAATCALTPFLVFNQQILTGRSLQPFHYEQFITNYVVLVGLILTYHLLWRHLKIRLRLWIVLAIAVGVTTALKEARDNSEPNMIRDRAAPVFKELDRLSNESPNRGFAVSNSTLMAASALTSSSVPQLWAPNMYSYGNTSDVEQIERFYQYLYLLGVDAKALEKDLLTSPQTRAAVFGLYRANSVITSNFRPVSASEIATAVQSYSAFVAGFSQQQARRWPLSTVIMIDETPYDLSNLDRWYVRDKGRGVGGSIIYLVRFRGGE